MRDEDRYLRSVIGLGEMVRNIEIKPKKIKEVLRKGYSRHMYLLELITLKKEKVLEQDYWEKYKEVAVYEIILTSFDEATKEMYYEAIEYFTDLKIDFFDPDEHAIVFEGEEYIMFPDDFTYFQQILSEQNNKEQEEEEREVKHENPMIEKLLKQKQENDKKLKEVKQRDGKFLNINFCSILSSVSAKSNSINKLNIGELTIPQLYDEYQRLNHFYMCDINDTARMNGAENIPDTHWSTEIR